MLSNICEKSGIRKTLVNKRKVEILKMLFSLYDKLYLRPLEKKENEESFKMKLFFVLENLDFLNEIEPAAL